MKITIFGIVAVVATTTASSVHAGLINLSSAPVVTSSNENAAHSGAKAFDNGTDFEDRWASVDPPAAAEWIYVDLGQKYKLDQVDIMWEYAFAADYTLRIFAGDSAPDPSTSLGSWTTVATITGRSGLDGDNDFFDEVFNFTAGSFTASSGAAVSSSVSSGTPQARYLLLHNTATDGGFGYSVHEFDVRVSPVPEPSSFCLLTTLGLLGLGMARRRRKCA